MAVRSKKRKSKKKVRRKVKVIVHNGAHNVYHPDYYEHVERAFAANGKTYYNFKNDTQIRTGRYMVIQNFLQEVNYRMDSDRLKLYIKKITEEIDGTKKSINIGNAIVYLNQMKNLTELAFEPDTVYRLASAVYFDDSEDLRTWEKKHNDLKIAGWKENGTLDFFYKRPFAELIGLKDISETVIQDYLEKAVRLIESYNSVLNSETQQPINRSSTMSV